MPPDLCPVADGGEGTMRRCCRARRRDGPGRRERSARPRRPAPYALLEDGATALVEVAEASGLGRVEEHERDAEAASTRGTGELIAAAIDAGAARRLVAAGGSATTDGGAGALEAIRRPAACAARASWCCATCACRGSGRRRLRAAEGRRRRRGQAAGGARSRRSPRVPARPARRADDGRGRRPRRRVVGGVRRGPRAGRRRSSSGRSASTSGCGRARAWSPARDGSTADAAGQGRRGVVTRTRQAGVPLHAIVGSNALDRFAARIVDLQVVQEATDIPEIEAAGERLGRLLASGEA